MSAKVCGCFSRSAAHARHTDSIRPRQSDGSRGSSSSSVRIREQVAKIQLGRDVDAVVSTPHGLWVTTYYAGIVARIDPAKAKVVRRLQVSGNASGVTFARGSVWVSDAG